MPRKAKDKRTESIQCRINAANEYLRNSADDRLAERKLIIYLTESMLHEANSYRGFGYLYWMLQGYKEWMENGQPEGLLGQKSKYIYGPTGDETRVYYY